MTFRWHADDDLTLNAGLVALSFSGIQTSIAKKTYIFVIFQGGPEALSPHLDPPTNISPERWLVQFPAKFI